MRMNSAPEVWVVIPTYNEHPNIERLIYAVHAAVPDATVLILDDHSPDGTADTARRAAEVIERVHVIDRPKKLGLGAAYRHGFRHALDAGAEIIVQMDADFSHDPAVIPALVAAVVAGADVAIGSRYVSGGTTPDWPKRRQWLSRYGNAYARWMLRIAAKDTTAGFRAYRAGILQDIDVDATQTNGYGFQIETGFLLTRQEANIVEFPIVFRDRTEGDSKMSVNIMSETMRLVTRWGIRLRLGKSVPERNS